MKPAALLLLMLSSPAFSAETNALAKARVARAANAEVLYVATALDHLTVLEFGEAVTMVAAGSPSFQIERQDDKVLVKPLRAGVSTNLLVWTESRRLIYELEAPGEVANMNFAVDSRAETAKLAASVPAPAEESVEAIMGKAFLAALPVECDGVRPARDGVSVRIEHLLLSKKNMYLHYSVMNRGPRAYLLRAPRVDRVLLASTSLSPPGRRRAQVSVDDMKKIRKSVHIALEAASVQMTATEVRAGERAEGVIALPRPLADGSVLELTFPPDGKHQIEAGVVL